MSISNNNHEFFPSLMHSDEKIKCAKDGRTIMEEHVRKVTSTKKSRDSREGSGFVFVANLAIICNFLFVIIMLKNQKNGN